MPIQVLMPALSPTMRSGRLARWLVAAGDRVAPGDVMAEIETDTATMEVEAVDAGRVERLLVAAGTDGVAVDTPIATILGDDEAGEGADIAAPGSGLEAAPSVHVNAGAAPSLDGRRRSAADRGRICASPLARRLAAEAGYDLAEIAGSGPEGRIVKRDVLAFVPRAAPRREREPVRAERRQPDAPRAASAFPAASPSRDLAAPSVGYLRPADRPDEPRVPSDADIRRLYEHGSFDVIPHDQMRLVIAERLTLSKATVPHFYLRIDCRLDEVQRARKRMNGGPAVRGGEPLALTINDFVIKALALALQQVPAANVTWTGAAMLRHHSSDVGVAVAIEGGLMTPVIRRAESKSLSEISAEMRELADRARRRRLAPHEYQGGATAISNLGMHGIREFAAVINPPQATILAVGAAEQRPVVVDGKLDVATLASCTLSCDHRAVDGAVGAELLAAFKALIEDPLRMLV
jgi:pyruvate dehydrogenase E2 component (dihydrolipoamide acetyltransferase)